MAKSRPQSQPDPTPREDAREDARAVPLIEMLLAVHGAQSSNWLADSTASAAERGLGALYGLLYLTDASGRLAGVKPGSSERVRALVPLRQELDVDLTAHRFDPSEAPAVASVLQTGRGAAVTSFAEALPLRRAPEELEAAQRRLGIGEIYLAPAHWHGQSVGLVLLFMPQGSPAPAELAELLGRHVAVAQGNLHDEEQGRKHGELDAVRWVYDERRFLEQLTMEVRRAQRHTRPLSVLVLRVVNLKELYSRYGRFLAERVLRQVAGRLTDAMRDTDFLGAHGEDGLAAILVEADREGALRAEERLMASLQSLELPYAELPDLNVELVYASATVPDDGASPEEITAAAEARLSERIAAEEEVA
jgi:diguanylate cyclase (GGDEF)-like protein